MAAGPKWAIMKLFYNNKKLSNRRRTIIFEKIPTNLFNYTGKQTSMNTYNYRHLF